MLRFGPRVQTSSTFIDPKITMRKTHTVVPIEEIQIDTRSRDDSPRMVLALKSLSESRDRHVILEMLQKGIGATVDQENGRPGMDTWRIFVLAMLKVGLNCDFDRLTHIANNDVLVRQMLQHDAFDFDGTPKYTQQTVVNHVALVTQKMWSKIHQIIVKHGHEIFGVSPDAPLEVRCDSYVVESHIETPHDVRILRDSVLKSMRIAFQAFEKLGLATYDDITGWRQIQHLRMTLGNAYLAIYTSQKRAKYLELILVFFSLCFAWIKKYHLVLDKIKEIDPASKWILHLETAIGQFERQIDVVRRRLIDGETIGNAEKLLSLHAEYTRWIRKGKRYPKDVECDAAQCILKMNTV